MTVPATKASKEIVDGNTSPHKLISLLMAGLLERTDQARHAIAEGNSQDETILFEKIVAIIHGLRDNLNFEQGGDIAVNLNYLYEYMLERIAKAIELHDATEKLSVLAEVHGLMSEVKSGWDGVQEVVAA